MESFIASKNGHDGANSYNIVEIGRETKNKNFEYIINATDDQVVLYDIDESD